MEIAVHYIALFDIFTTNCDNASQGFCNFDQTPTHRGFDTFYGQYTSGADYFTRETDQYYDFRVDDEVVKEKASDYTTDLLNKRAIRNIKRHKVQFPLLFVSSLRQSLCLSVSSLRQSVGLSVCLFSSSVSVSVCLFVCLCVRLSWFVLRCFSPCASACLPVCLFVSLYVCLM